LFKLPGVVMCISPFANHNLTFHGCLCVVAPRNQLWIATQTC